MATSRSTSSVRTKTHRTNRHHYKIILSLDEQEYHYDIPNKAAFKQIQDIIIKLVGADICSSNKEPLLDADVVFDELFGTLPRWAVNIKGLRAREGLTQKAFAKKLGIEQQNVSLYESGKRAIGKYLEKKKKKVFGTDYRLFL